MNQLASIHWNLDFLRYEKNGLQTPTDFGSTVGPEALLYYRSAVELLAWYDIGHIIYSIYGFNRITFTSDMGKWIVTWKEEQDKLSGTLW